MILKERIYIQMNKRLKLVSRDEYLLFIQWWPNKLDLVTYLIRDPEVCTYNDFFSDPRWPESVVAEEHRAWEGRDGQIDFSCPGKYWEYYVLDVPLTNNS